MNTHLCRFAVVAMLIAPLAASAKDDSTLSKRLLSVSDSNELRYPEALQVSPDGRQVAFVVDDRIYVVSARGGDARPVTSASSSAWSPHWSADGGAIYFISDRADTDQIWKLDTHSYGEAEQLTRYEHGISSIAMSLNEQRVLLSLSDTDLEEKPAEADTQPFVVTGRQVKRDAGSGYITAGQQEHLHAYDLEAGEATQITSGRFNEDQAALSPDGRNVVFVSNREADPDLDYRNDLWVVPADEADGALRRLTHDSQTKHAPAWSPDGKSIAYIAAEDGVYGLQKIAIVPSAGGVPSVLTSALDRWVSAFEFSADGKWIYFTYENRGGSHLSRVRVADGRIETLIDGERTVDSFAIGASGNVAMALRNRNDAADLYLLRRGKVSRLTDLNHAFFDRILVGEKQKVSFTGNDGTEIEAFLTLPPAYEADRKYPAILNIHGGPVGQFTYGYDFSAQYLAANGYLVIEPNPRGSSGRGQAFIRAIYRSWGISDYGDVIGAVDDAIGRGLADPDRLAVTGYSYGGYMTNVVITNTTRFKAAASGAGHSLIAANYGHDIYQRWYNWELGVPWENREAYDRLSPLLRVGNVETPTIFLGGREDWNVPILNAELFYQSLKVKGVDTELVVYPGAHHGGWSEDFEQDYLERLVEWFDRYLESK